MVAFMVEQYHGSRGRRTGDDDPLLVAGRSLPIDLSHQSAGWTSPARQVLPNRTRTSGWTAPSAAQEPRRHHPQLRATASEGHEGSWIQTRPAQRLSPSCDSMARWKRGLAIGSARASVRGCRHTRPPRPVRIAGAHAGNHERDGRRRGDRGAGRAPRALPGGGDRPDRGPGRGDRRCAVLLRAHALSPGPWTPSTCWRFEPSARWSTRSTTSRPGGRAQLRMSVASAAALVHAAAAYLDERDRTAPSCRQFASGAPCAHPGVVGPVTTYVIGRPGPH